jgi:hypothetical protein
MATADNHGDPYMKELRAMAYRVAKAVYEAQ